MIAQKTVQAIFEAAKIEEVVSDYVQLKKRGVNYIGLCPFHHEKTPSFNVSPVKNIYKCFGCGVGGSPVNFIMELEQLSYPEALRTLARKYNIPVEEDEISVEQSQQLQVADSLYVVNQFAQSHFAKQLWETDYGKSVGLSYLKQRGFREEIIRKFGLGFANGGSNDLLHEANQQGYETPILEQAGLVKNNRDFFRNRVQFPIHNRAGKVIGFGGRILTKNKKAPKYLNTPETDIYNKRKSLYGIYFARKAVAQQNLCYLVEGYTDVISLHQAGIENIVASSGTSLTVEQIQLVKRYTPNFTMLFDGDKAGIRAALRGLDLVIEQDMNVRVVLLPDGEDPDSYLQKVGTTAFQTYLKEEAKDFILFKSDLLLKDAQNDPIKRAEVLQDIVGTMAKIPDALKRATYIRECATLLEVSESLLHTEVNKRINRSAAKRQQRATPSTTKATPLPDPTAPATPTAPSNKKLGVFQETDIVRLLVNFGDRPLDEETSVAEFILLDMVDLLSEFEDKLCRQVVQEYLEHLQHNRPIDGQYFIQHANPAIAKLAVDVVAHMERHHFSEGWQRLNVYLNTQHLPDANHIADAKSGILRFKLKKIERLIYKNQQEIKVAQEARDETNLMLNLKIHQKLQLLKMNLAKALNTVVLR